MDVTYSNEDFTRFVRREINESQLLGKKEEGVFQIGDRVIGKDVVHDSVPLKGRTGTVKYVKDKSFNGIAVEFDGEGSFIFHNCNGRTKPRHGYWVNAEHLEHE